MSELRRLFDLVCNVPAAQRGAALRDAGAGAALAAEVLALLDADSATLTRSRAGVNRMIAQLGATELHAGDTLGAWRLLREIGHGGMGAVYLAERADGHFTQQAAIKLLRGLVDAESAARFARERQLLANLQHPQIARLLDGGATPAGAPYLIMEYVEGIALDAWCEAEKPALDARLRVLVSICKTLQFAHDRLVVHCDLKPSNVLVRADGVPVLLDFGIAHALDPGEAGAGAAQRFLTPRYASPEQARGETPTVASDVYALGLLLYRLAADEAPPAFDTERPTTAPAPSRTGTAVPWRAQLRGDLDAIARRACAIDPERRYRSALALAEDMARIARHEPVLARPHTPLYVGARLLRRRWPLFAAAALILALATGFTWRTVLAEREARTQAQVAEQTTEFLISAFALSDPTSASRHDFSAREVLDQGRARIAKELAGQPRVRARLLEALGNAYRGINEGSAGAPLLEEAAQLYLDPAVNDPRAAARSLRAKALGIHDARLASDEAANAARRALDLTERHASDDALALAEARRTYALTATTSVADALNTSREALRLREQAGAVTLAAQSRVDLCTILTSAGEFQNALGECENALAAFRKVGATHGNEYRMALNEYATVLYYLGDYARGLAAERERLALSAELFGKDSTTYALDQSMFAETLAERGQFAEAQTLIAESTPLILRRNGAQSVQYSRAVFRSGWLEYLRGNFDAAVPLLRQAIAVHEAALDGKDSDRLHVLRTDLAAALIEAGRADAEARGLLDQVVAQLDPNDEGVQAATYARVALARWYAARRLYPDAERQLAMVDAIGTKVEPEVHARVADTRAAIARAQADEATTLRQSQLAYDIALKDTGAQDPRVSVRALRLARDLRSVRQDAQAAELEDRYRALFEKAYPIESAYRSELDRRRTGT